MVTAEISGGRIALDAPLADSVRIKSIPGKRYDTARRRWTVPLSWAACVQLRANFGADLAVGPDLACWAKDQLETRILPATNVVREAKDLDPRLFDYQVHGVNWLIACQSGLLGDEQGAGKTCQVVQALTPDHLPALVVCPSSVKDVWRRHVAEWRPDLSCVVLASALSAKKRAELIDGGGYDVLVVGWEQLRLHSSVQGYGQISLTPAEKRPKELNAVGFRCVVADEAHRAKDPSSKQTRALWAVSADAPHRLALTGTPLANAPDDLWAVMRFVCPEEYPTRSAFVDRYCATAYSPFSQTPVVIGLRPEARPELDRFLTPRFLRRLKAEVLPELPEVIREVRLVEMDAKQARAYRELRKNMRCTLPSGDVLEVGKTPDGADDHLTLTTRLLQLASSSLVDDQGAWACDKPSCKVDALLELADERRGRPTVVFAESSRLLTLCSRELHKAKVEHAMLTGDVSEAQRNANVERFQRGELAMLLVTLGAGGEGITLTAADTVIFLQRSWSMVKNLQAEARVHRPGQTAGSVHVLDIRSAGTVESRVLRLFGTKLDRLEELVRDKDVLRRLLEDDEEGTTR